MTDLWVTASELLLWYLLTFLIYIYSVLQMFSYTTYRPVYNASMVGGLSWSWWDGSWIYNYVYNRCLSQLTLWVRIPLRRGVLDTVFCDKVCQWLAAGQWFSPGTSVSSTNKSDPHDITEILLTVVLTTITLTRNEPWPVMNPDP